MAQFTSYNKVDLSAYAAGGTIQLPLDTNNFFVLYNDVTLGGGLTITDDGTPVEGNLYMVRFDGTITTGASTVSFFGQNVAEAYLQSGMFALAYYDGSAYKVSIMPSFLVSEIILNANIADATIALGKLANGAAGSFIQYNASGVPTATALSGDGTLSNTGVLTIANSAITTAKINNAAVTTEKINNEAVTTAKLDTTLQSYLNQNITLAYVNVPIPTAEVLTGNSVPVVIVGAVAGKIIKPLFVIETITYATTPYTTNLVTQIIYDGATDAYMTAPTTFLGGTTTKTIEMQYNAINAATDTQILANADLLWRVGTGDPLAGDSDVTVTCIYVLLDA
jgi:hypothetical protein